MKDLLRAPWPHASARPPMSSVYNCRKVCGRDGMLGERVSGEQARWRPQPRAVEVLPTIVQGQQLYCLRDHVEPDGPAVLVSRDGILLLSLMDGERDLLQLRSAFALRTGQLLPLAQLEEFVSRLDDAYLLLGPRFE